MKEELLTPESSPLLRNLGPNRLPKQSEAQKSRDKFMSLP